MSKYRKKPIDVEAFHYTFYSEEFRKWAHKIGFVDWFLKPHEPDIWMITPEGELKVSAGDWIIKGIKGEFYPCRPDIFDLTYELIED